MEEVEQGNKNGNVTAIDYGFSSKPETPCDAVVNTLVFLVVVILRLSTVNGFQLPPSCMLNTLPSPFCILLSPQLQVLLRFDCHSQIHCASLLPVLLEHPLANLPVCGWAICFLLPDTTTLTLQSCHASIWCTFSTVFKEKPKKRKSYFRHVEDYIPLRRYLITRYISVFYP